MNLSKENNVVNLNKPEGVNTEAPVENMVNNTNVNEAAPVVEPMVEPVVNLNKAEGAPANSNGFTNPLDKIDLEKVHNMEVQAGQAFSDEVNNAVGQMQNAFDKASQKFNNFVDGLDKPNNANQQFDQYGQPVVTPHTNPQYGTNPGNNGYNPNMNNPGYNPNMGQGQPGFNQNMGMGMNPQMMAGMVTPDKLKVEPAIAALLSFLLTGLGQMINGQVEKGLTLLFGGMAAVFIITLVTCGIGAITAPVVIIVSIVDAYKCAQILQSGRPIGKWEFHIFD